MFKLIKSRIEQAKNGFRVNKKREVLLLLIYLFEYFVFFSIPVLSGLEKWHYVPLVFCAFECLLIFFWLYFYGGAFIDKNVILLITFPLFCLLESFFTGFRIILLTYFLLTGMCIFFYEFVSESNDNDAYLRVWYFALVSFALIFVIVYFKELINFDISRLGSAFDNVNEVSQFFSMGMLFSLFYFVKNRKKNWFFVLFYLGFAFLGITTGSKQFLFSSVIITVVGIFLALGKNHIIWAFLSVAVLAAVVVVMIQFPVFATMKTRIVDFMNFLGIMKTNDRDYSSEERFAIFSEALNMFFQKPLFGFGPDGFLRYSYFGTYSHTTFGDLLCNFGIVGTVLFCYPFFSSAGKAFNKDWKVNSDRILFSLLAVLFGCFAISAVLMSDKVYYIALPLILSLPNNRTMPADFAEISIKRKGPFQFSVSYKNKTISGKQPTESDSESIDI
jgi:hypothetical protein